MGNMADAADELTALTDSTPAADVDSGGSDTGGGGNTSKPMSTTDDTGNIVQLGIDPDTLHTTEFKQ